MPDFFWLWISLAAAFFGGRISARKDLSTAETEPLEWCVAEVRYCDLKVYLNRASLTGWEVDTLDPYTDPRCEFDEGAFDGYRVIMCRPFGTDSAT